MYASEPNFGGVSGKLKLQMRNSIRQNRSVHHYPDAQIITASMPFSGLRRRWVGRLRLGLMTARTAMLVRRLKDVRHKCPHHATVIEEIGQMWWNPKNGFVRDRSLFGAAVTAYVLSLRLSTQHLRIWLACLPASIRRVHTAVLRIGLVSDWSEPK